MHGNMTAISLFSQTQKKISNILDGTEIKLNYINFFLKREIVSSLYPPTNLVTYSHTHTHTHTAHTHTSPSIEYMATG